MCPVLKKPMDILVTARGKNKFIALSSVDNPGSGVRYMFYHLNDTNKIQRFDVMNSEY